MKRKVMFLIEDGSFTYDNRVKREVSALLGEHWDVTVVCPKNKDDPYYRKYNSSLRAYFYSKPEARTSAGHIFEHIVSILSLQVLSWVVYLRHGFSVIHAANPMDILWIPALPFKLFGVRYIFDHHDLCPELYLSRGEGGENSTFFRVLSWLERMSFRVSDVVISTNESYKNIAMDRGHVAKENVFVVRNGPNLEKFKQVEAAGGLKGEGEILVGYLGNMNPQDGVDYLLRAAREIVQDRSITTIRFVLVGGGSYQSNLVEMSKEMGLDSYVRFTGRIPDAEMLSTLSACDICVQPDPSNPLNDRSTMNKVMEYMALEKPVIAFDLKETRVSCGNAALYAEPNDISDMADKIIELAESPERRGEMGKMGNDRVRNELAWSYSVPHLLAAYDRLKDI